MKRLFLFLLLIAFFVCISAQNHIEFMGVPVDGNINDFIVKLEAKQFKVKKRIDNIVIMNGKFAGESAEIFVASTNKTKTVWKVSVYFDEKSSWYSLKADYKKYKELFTAKYGKPTDSFEFFSNPYYEGDGYELSALKRDKCHYATFFEKEIGIIAVQMSSVCSIELIYEDALNSEIKNREKNSSILDDI